MLPSTILIIDDEPVIRHTTSVLLSKKGIDARGAETGQKGLDMAKREQPELILLDLVLPDMDGWTVLERLRAAPETASIPVVLFSAGDYDETVSKARNEGVHRVLRKPFQLDQLMEVCELPG